MEFCRSCGTPLLKPFLDLGNSPLSNGYLSEKNIHVMEPYYPLEVYYCPHCSLVQLDEFEAPEQIFSSDYAYFSSYSSSWLSHCKLYVEMMVKRFGFDKESFVIEIASNDGYLLQYFKEHNIPVKGVEPAKGTAEIAIAKEIPTDITFFNTGYANALVSLNCPADLIIGNNVLAHNPNLNDFAEGLRIALKPHGVITIEFPHTLQLIENNQFDTIYQEHYSYLSLYSVRYLFNAHRLDIFDVDELPTHGGSLRIYAKHHADPTHDLSPRVAEILDKEKQAGLLDPVTYEQFRRNVEATKRALLQCLISAKNEGKTIVGYGAPAKGNTLLNYCGIRTDFLDYTVDANPHKQNLFLPGTHIPIKHPDQIRIDKPEYILILPWNIKEEIMDQLSFAHEWGGKFIIPIPSVEVIDA
ncbi:MAG: class I SAM-dependent methyltransferase [Methanomicrobiales archaeon]